MFRQELMWNKVIALIFVILGVATVFVGGDATFFVFSLMFGIPLFFSKQNWIYRGVDEQLQKKTIENLPGGHS